MGIINVIHRVLSLNHGAAWVSGRLSFRRRHASLAQSSGMYNMRKSTTFILAGALVSEIRTFECMSIGALITLLAEAQTRKGVAYWCIFVDMNMRVAAIVFVAGAVLEVNAVGRPVRRWLV